VQRCSRDAVDARQAPPAASRYGQTAAVSGAIGGSAARLGPGPLIGTEDTRPIQAVDRLGSLRERKNPGDDLFSRKAALSVSSALESLTSVFGMGTGMASPLESPGFVASGRVGSGALRTQRCGPGGRRKRSSISGGVVKDRITIPATDPWSVAEEVKPSTISTAQLHPSPDFHMRPIKQVVYLRSYPVKPVGNLISRRASHLDAFSAYPCRT
jgi:hypothetical protein